MTFRSKIGKTYPVTGTNIGAWKNYTKPKSNNPHFRGVSVGRSEFSLEGRNITILEHIHQTDVGIVKGKKDYAAFEVVKVSVEGKKGEYYAWVVYEGDSKIPLEEAPSKDDSVIKPFENKEENKEEFTVPAGKTTAVDAKSKTKPADQEPDYSDKPFSVALLDESGNIRKCNGFAVFINDSMEETYIEIKNGVGGADTLPAGSYKVIFDNQKINVDVPSNASGFGVTNPYFCRPGFVYQVDPQQALNIIDSKPYASFWPALYSGENDFYSGVVTGATIYADPKTPNKAQILGGFKPGEYFTMDKVLMHAKTESRPDAETMAFRFSKPGMEGKNLFAMLTTDVSIIPAAADFNHDGQPGLVQLRTNVLAMRNVNGPGERVYTKTGTTAKKEAKPQVSHIRWYLPTQTLPLTEKHDIRKLYHHSQTGIKEQILGVCYKPGVRPEFEIALEEPLSLPSFKFKVAFWPTKMITMVQNAPGRFKTMYNKNRLKKKDDKKEYVVFKEFTITAEATPAKKYRIKLDKDDFYDIVNRLDIEINNAKIGISVLTDETPGKIKFVTSKMFAFPVLQHIILFLPGLFGSEISVYNEFKKDIQNVWANAGNIIDKQEVELLECRDDGKVVRAAIESELKVLNTVAGLDVYTVQESITTVNNSNIFPNVSFQRNGDIIPYLVYAPAPYDWRLSLDKVNANPIFDEFPFLGHVHQRMQVAYNNALTLSESQFVDNSVILSGHSTGGVMIQGLLSLAGLELTKNGLSMSMRDRVKAVFYMNVPALGAPKAELMRTTGNGFESLINPESLRQIAFNLPVAYILAPNTGYARITGEPWTRDDQKKRFLDIVRKYRYEIWPKRMVVNPEILDNTRSQIKYNKTLSNLAEKYFHLWMTKYPKDIPSYIFHFSCRNTTKGISEETLLQLKLSNQERIDKAVKHRKKSNRHLRIQTSDYVREFSGSLRDQILNSLLESNVNNLITIFKDQSVLPSSSSADLIEIYKIWEKQDDRLLAENIHSVWHLYYFLGDNESIQRMVEIEIDNSVAIAYRYESNLNFLSPAYLVWDSTDFGDETVPQVSQVGLWYMLSHNSPLNIKNKTNYHNIHLMEETPLDQADEHKEGANPPWVWERVAKVLGKQDIKLIQKISTGSCESKTTQVISGEKEFARSTQLPSKGSMVSVLYDSSNNPLPVNTVVTLQSVDNTFTGDFSLSEPGLLKVDSLNAGSYKVINIVLPQPA